MTTENPPGPKVSTVATSLWPAAEEGSLPGCDGTPLFFRAARPPGPARAGILITHGLGEHSTRYGHVATFLVARGFAVYAWDLRGHGRSAGARGDVADDALLVRDFAAVHARFREETRRLFLFAHSLGGQIVLRYLQENEVACPGAVIASPWLRLAFDPPWWKLALARLAMRCWPGFVQHTGNRWHRLSRDREHMASFPDLDLVHRRISARLYFAARATGERVLANAPRLRTPLLLLHGADDPITSHHATTEFFERAGSADKTLRIFPDTRHETHNDLARAQVLREARDWLEARAGC